ncbi:hypothetical protein CPB84DRAFT_1812600 [Gymnopilus junonius]|uniref:Chromatin assembly factor 1 subunit A dimerization domain-containing protein n=1 Tax=Gymnopilus junonius TaxID=109634 RepID=A0A9P5NW58_GYMJU|nr:hypothetical protein CPB84DRAFT_1812600 [Gymnopilus junonius]
MSTPELTQEKQERTPIVELRNGKVVFKQKPISFEKQSETLQEIVKFRGLLEERINRKEGPLSPLIAKLAHESEKTLTALGKHIHHELLPTVDDDEDKDIASATSDALPLNLVENAIQEILVRNNYGIDLPLGVKAPAATSVWRWEVRTDHLDWLPKNSREKLKCGVQNVFNMIYILQAKEDLKLLLGALSQEERNVIIDPKGTNKLPPKELNKPNSSQSTVADDAKVAPQSSKKEGKRKAEEPENDNVDAKAAANRPKKPIDPEKVAKEKERLEKKAARAEKERKEKEAHNKSQNLMAKFFSKTKASSPTKISESAVAGPSKVQSDFEKVFKPFVLQKDRVMAPTNWFRKKRKQAKSKTSANNEVIFIDNDEDEDVEMRQPQPTKQELETMSSQERLHGILTALPPAPIPHCRPPQKPGFTVYNPISVRDLVSQLSEAEISGNDELVRTLLAKLKDRDLLPAKVFCFHEDARPGYFGTWTRNSRIIGSRKPFGKDTIGEEWEEEPAGEDVAEDGEEKTKNGQKTEGGLPLVPFAKGPMFESVIGKCDYEPFRPYTIQLFNDTPMSIDPFTFVSTCLEDYKESLRNSALPKDNTDGATFAVPALPPRLTSDSKPIDSPDSVNGTAQVPKKAPVVPKAPFPDIHVQLLFDRITQLQASSISALVESIHLELREHKVKKNAIEAKIREIGEKCKEKRVWVVKPALLYIIISIMVHFYLLKIHIGMLDTQSEASHHELAIFHKSWVYS